MSWLLTTAVMAGVLVLLVAIGLVVARGLAWNRPWTADDWLDAPFLGMATLIIVLQNGVYLGLPLRVTSWPFVALVGVALIATAWRGRFRGMWAVCPSAPYLVALGVLGIHGCGLWIVGIRAYTGRGWGDQISYSFIAQYLIDFVYGSTPSVSEPAALIGFVRGQSRIGQSTLHGFFTVLVPLGPKALFEPTILLSPLLVSLAMFAHGVRARLPRYLVLALAAVAALLPAVATVHLESFLSHALALPCLLYLPILLDRAADRGSWGDYLRAGLVAASTTAIYLEFFFFLETCVLVFAIFAWFETDGRKRNLSALAVVALLPVFLRMTRGLAGVVGYLNQPVLGDLYPWAFSLEGVERLWAGDLVGAQAVAGAPAARILAVGLLGAGYFGLLRQVTVEVIGATDGSPRRFHGVSRALCTFGLALVPLAVLVRDDQHAYQFYKLLMTMAPLIVWGAGCGAWYALAWTWPGQRKMLVVAGVLAVGVVAGWGTLSMAKASAEPMDRPRQSTGVTLDPGFLAVEQHLEGTSGRDVIQCVSDGVNLGYANAWFTLFGHKNRTWVLNPQVNDAMLPNLAGPSYFRQVSGSLPDPLILTSTLRAAVWANQQLPSTGVDFGSYRLFQPGHQPVALMCSPTLVAEKNGTGAIVVPPGGADFVIYSTVAGPGVVTFHVPTDDPAYTGMGVRVNDDSERQPAPWDDKAGIVAVPLLLGSGVTRVTVVAPMRLDGRPVQTDQVTLWLAEFGLPLVVTRNPNGLETVDGRRYFWLGGGVTTIDLFSPARGVAVLSLDTVLGDSVQHTTLRRLRVTGGNGPSRVIDTHGGALTIDVPVGQGWTQIGIEPLDPLDTKLAHDPRPLVLGVRQVSARLEGYNK